MAYQKLNLNDGDVLKGDHMDHIEDGIVANEREHNKLSNIIVKDFDPYIECEQGDYVRYNGSIYRCTTTHEGEWDSADFAEPELSDLAKRVQSNAKKVSGAVRYDISQSLSNANKQQARSNIGAL